MIKPDENIKTPWSKRVFDIIASMFLLTALSPLLLLFIIALFIEQLFSTRARGPLLYCEDRVSGGRLFKLRKIRVCAVSAYKKAFQEDGFIHTVKVEKMRANYLKVGWWLHKIYLDEAPQLWNVLTGDLSLVGPRPANTFNYQKMLAAGIYTKKAIKSGLTGYFQAYKGHASQRSDIEMDTEYIEFCKTHGITAILLFDLKILFLTLCTVIEHKGI